jgi:hypothetical protein
MSDVIDPTEAVGTPESAPETAAEEAPAVEEGQNDSSSQEDPTAVDLFEDFDRSSDLTPEEQKARSLYKAKLQELRERDKAEVATLKQRADDFEALARGGDMRDRIVNEWGYVRKGDLNPDLTATPQPEEKIELDYTSDSFQEDLEKLIEKKADEKIAARTSSYDEEIQRSNEERALREWQTFVGRYPDADNEDMKTRMAKLVEKGVVGSGADLIHAYGLAKMEKQIEEAQNAPPPKQTPQATPPPDQSGAPVSETRDSDVQLPAGGSATSKIRELAKNDPALQRDLEAAGLL